MELTLVLIAATLLLGLLSPVAFALVLFTRDREDGTAGSTTEN
ncbi:hypothetical protein HAPAU_05870 [Halalkalicoccus paucihalophilus]|uniref:Uncharacterized protein n=1 Tax=Halalkalicoccus paucihalophilus TaxID=1008153 RepID=A0A151AJY8_9EURY|nr:hypothetical protein [Halalkalicoccus paucihalophilus]KYH27912.1 hypothetical protein HAPAU_05870 [Halalkalicoccus paucihalophilus]